jgi:signal transduction histidine kinase
MLDEEWISQALRRILDNALLYTPEGGHIHITADRSATGLTISVSDTGIGIDERHIGKIFDRFYKVNSARTSGEGGSGIGLSLVKKIVQMHGGQINVESIPGQGSIFHIVLPIAPEIK